MSVITSYQGAHCILLWGRYGDCRSRTGQHRCGLETRHDGACVCRYCDAQR